MRLSGFIAAGVIALALLGWVAFRYWPAEPRAEPHFIAAYDEFGARTGASMVGVQPWLTPADYRDALALRQRLDGYVSEAARMGWITERSVVVFPEHIGTWLVAVDAPAAAYGARGVDGAMTALIAARPFGFLGAYLRSDEADRAAAAIFRMRADAMAAAYTDVFGALARDYGVTIAAGSIVLPAPRIEDGRVVAGDGPLYNVSAVFGPDGRAMAPLVLKTYPIPSEAGFTAAGPAEQPVFDTPAGRLGVLICADSWHPDLYESLREGGAELLAVPAYLQPSGIWAEPWGGYVTPWPDDAYREHAGLLTEGEAWVTYSMPGRAGEHGLRAGLTVFLDGRLWDLGADGRTLARAGDAFHVGSREIGGVISVLWLEEEG
ncbi:MAG: hypothetical protein KIS81_06485 [Maricaulaceae bacterium]|nr:hypothetical protein [Maricaulaceae bacterium]